MKTPLLKQLNKTSPITLRPYQEAAVKGVYEHLRSRDDNPLVVIPTAGGKTPVMSTICRDAVTKWHGRVLILAHVKELLQQTAETLEKVAPDLEIGIYSAGLKSRDTKHPVIVAGIQSVYKRACELDKFDLIIVDECFPAGTMISTPRGDTPIEDLYVGQPVHTAMGVGEVEAISAKPAYDLFELEFENGKTIRCTPNHPFFTEKGWREAKTLEVGSCLFSCQDMQDLRNYHEASHLLSSRRLSEELRRREQVERQNVLLEEVHGESQEAGCMAISQNSSGEEDMSVLWQNLPSMDQTGRYGKCDQLSALKRMETATFLFNLLCEESGESHVDSGYSTEGQSKAQGYRTRTEQSRRQRTTDRTTDSDASVVGSRLVSRACSSNGTLLWTTLQHQDRYSQSEDDDSCRVGRPFTWSNKKAKSRQVEDDIFASQRLVRITPVQCQSPVPVFNLQVAGHPSYYADGVLAHNCHMIPLDGEGMYRQFLSDAKVINPLIRVIGLTATPYRLKAGMIAQDDHFLNSICYEVGVKELIEDGYLCPLKSKAGKTKAKLDNLHIRAGEFISSEVESAMDSYSLVQSACDEIAELTKERNKVLIFTSGVKHGKHVCDTLRRDHNIECGFITGDTPGLEREGVLYRFKNGDLKFLVNVNVLTTGFDAPNIDCVVLLRPTNSPGLYYQMVGRGFRLHPSKTDCLVLDYGGNILRHGPVDDLQIKEPGQSSGDAPAKECPECLSLIHASYAKCPDCGYEFPPPEKEIHESQASNAGILTGQVSDTEYDVIDVAYSVHTKRGADPGHPKTMRIQYCTGFNSYASEWVCPEHTGYARGKFEKWWYDRSREPFPDTALEAVELAQRGAVAQPSLITVRSVTGEKYDRIIGYELSEIPPRLDGSDERELVTTGDSMNDWYDDDEIPF